MAVTKLHPNGLPGQPYSFTAKGAGGKPSTQVTALGVMATPGGLRAFVAKGEAVVGKPDTQITALAVMALPGQIHVFEAKTAAVIITPTPTPTPTLPIGGGGAGRTWEPVEDFDRDKGIDDEEELVILAMAILEYLEWL